MLPLTIVKVTCDPVESLLHVLRCISLCLLDVCAIELRDAVHYNDLELLKYLILDPKCPLGGGFSVSAVKEAMEVAIATNRMKLLKFLMVKGPVFYANTYRSSAVAEAAARHGHLKALQWMLEERRVSCSNLVLAEAAQHGHLRVLQFLMEFSAGQKGRYTVDIQSLACRAASNGHQQVVEYLVKAFHLAEDEVRTIRECAVRAAQFRLVGSIDLLTKNRRRENLSSLFPAGPKVELLVTQRDLEEFEWLAQRFHEFPQDPKLLICACKVGELTKTEWLVHRLKPDQAIFREALSMACTHGHIDVVQLLIRHGANPASFMVDLALVNGQLEMVRYLQEEVNIVSLVGQPFPTEALCNAARTGNVPMLMFLLSVPLDAKGYYREAMKQAFLGGHLAIAQCLVEHFRQNNLEENRREELASLIDELKDTPIHMYSLYKCRGMFAVFRLLLCQEPQRDLTGEDFSRIINIVCQSRPFVPLLEALHERKVAGFNDSFVRHAARCGHFKTVQFFFEHQLGTLANCGFEAAAGNGHLRIVKYLFSLFGEQLQSCKTAFQHAARNGHWRVMGFIHDKTHVEDEDMAQAFLEAAGSGHLQVVKFLLSKEKARQMLNIQEAFCRACSGTFVNVMQWLAEHAAAEVDVEGGLHAI